MENCGYQVDIQVENILMICSLWTSTLLSGQKLACQMISQGDNSYKCFSIQTNYLSVEAATIDNPFVTLTSSK